MNLNERNPQLGFHSADGAIVPLAELNVNSLPYIGLTSVQLYHLLEQKISREHYEECALIRDELSRRTVKIKQKRQP
ncbi:oligoendopeptidase F family protein [Mucilaginibacter achroorhodeus]|uniref:Oligoendopeptidase F family protein n=1 Tax=Mucilaginibacter achroorhodeus TaxID=2599294 RepID=A0A563U4C6_9SPHI|nr:oligoendopeptidase F family protein [Mucilaginibacter achroorhodeus]TWR26191.1 oligoendopeptidase F family protein [Mucilaginibacter achroorhodeus]